MSKCKNRICEVCYLIDGDTKAKDVEYCETCKACICKECRPNLFRRGKAAILKQIHIL